MIIFSEIILLFILLFFSALFSGSETAFFSLSPLHLERLALRRSDSAREVIELLKFPAKLLVGILSGNMLVNVSATVLITSAINDVYPGKGAEIAVPVMTFLLLFFGEITPKVIAARWNMRFATGVAVILRHLIKILKPISIIAEKVGALVGPATLKNEELTEADLRMAIDILRRGGNLNANAIRALLGALELDRLKLEKFAVPQAEWKVFSPSSRVADVRIVLKKSDDIAVIMKSKNILGIVDSSMLAGVDEDELLENVAQIPMVISEKIMPSAYLARAFVGDVFYAVLSDDRGEVIGILSLKRLLRALISEEYFGGLSDE